MNKKNKEWGFTLLEVIAILFVLGIIAAVVISGYMSRQAYESISQTEIFKSHLRYAQQLSLNGDDTLRWGIQIGAGTASYNLGSLPNPYTVMTVNGTLPGESGPTHNFPSGVTLAGVIASQIISFDQWGSTNANSITISVIEGSVTKSFTITGNTGFIQ